MKNSRIIPSSERFVSGRGITDLWHHLRKKKRHDDTEIEKQVDFLIGNEKIKTIAIIIITIGHVKKQWISL